MNARLCAIHSRVERTATEARPPPGAAQPLAQRRLVMMILHVSGRLARDPAQKTNTSVRQRPLPCRAISYLNYRKEY